MNLFINNKLNIYFILIPLDCMLNVNKTYLLIDNNG